MKLNTGEIVVIVAFIGGNLFYVETKDSVVKKIHKNDISEVIRKVQ